MDLRDCLRSPKFVFECNQSLETKIVTEGRFIKDT